MKTTA